MLTISARERGRPLTSAYRVDLSLRPLRHSRCCSGRPLAVYPGGQADRICLHIPDSNARRLSASRLARSPSGKKATQKFRNGSRFPKTNPVPFTLSCSFRHHEQRRGKKRADEFAFKLYFNQGGFIHFILFNRLDFNVGPPYPTQQSCCISVLLQFPGKWDVEVGPRLCRLCRLRRKSMSEL